MANTGNLGLKLDLTFTTKWQDSTRWGPKSVLWIHSKELQVPGQNMWPKCLGQ